MQSAVSAFDLLCQRTCTHRLSCGDDGIDHVIGGGLSVGLTEMSGEAGSGKSQFAYQTALSAVASGGHALLIVVAGESFSPERLLEMSFWWTSRYGARDWLKRIRVQKVSGADKLRSVIQRVDEDRHSDIRFIAVDSIAAAYRTDDAAAPIDYRRRAEEMFDVAAAMKRLAHRRAMPILILNQVTDVIAAEEDASTAQRSLLAPALGLSWRHCPNVRIMLFRDRTARTFDADADAGADTHTDTRNVVSSKRTLTLVSSPMKQAESISIYIDSAGVHSDRHATLEMSSEMSLST